MAPLMVSLFSIADCKGCRKLIAYTKSHADVQPRYCVYNVGANFAARHPCGCALQLDPEGKGKGVLKVHAQMLRQMLLGGVYGISARKMY